MGAVAPALLPSAIDVSRVAKVKAAAVESGPNTTAVHTSKPLIRPSIHALCMTTGALVKLECYTLGESELRGDR
jgi:hypothetical protein